jgi:transposase-like protein
VFEACYLWEEKMAQDHRRPVEEVVQEVLLDDPGFLKEIVERMLQQLLEAEMTEHIGAAPYERVEERTGHRNGHRPRALRTRVGTLNLLVPQDLKKGPSPAGSSPASSETRRPWCWL